MLMTIAVAVQFDPALAAKPAGRHSADEPSLRFGDYLAGRTAQLDHDWRTAAPLMVRAWQADRDNETLRHDAFILSIAGGEFAAATQIAHAVPAESGDGPLANFVLAIDDLSEGRYPLVGARLATVPPQGLNRYLVPLITAWSEVGRGRKTEAMAAVRQLDSVQGATELRNAQTAMVADALGDRAQATLLYDKLIDGNPQPRLLILAAGYYQRQNRVDLARAAIERLEPDGSSSSLRAAMLARLAAGRAPPSPDARNGAADALFEIAASLSGNGDRAEIAPLLYTQLALHLRPSFPSAQLLLAEIDQRWGRLDDAVEDLLSVDEKSELRSTAVRLAMVDLNRMGQTERAIKVGQAGTRAHPEDIDLLLSYADLLRQKADFVDAIAAYDAALMRIATTSGRRGLALFRRGMTYQRANQWTHAETDLLAALQLRPDDPSLLNYLAFAWAERGVNLDRARAMLERALQLAPDDGAIIDSLGWVMFQAGDYAEAVMQLERAAQLDADDASITDHLGDAYWRAGRQIEARTQWERAARLTTDKTLAEQLKMKIRDGLAEGPQPRHAAVN
jgi:tetratricopeptide (TPR) repeat protein